MALRFSTQKLAAWLDERLGLTAYRQWASKKVVPVHRHAFWYYWGGIALMYLGLQVATGMLLMVYYIPEVKSAHASILAINSLVDFGWFFRSLHSWGSSLLMLTLFIHMFSTYFMKAYRPPREITWWSGLALLGIVMGFGFSGYLLPWDDVAFFATKIGMDIAMLIPFVGKPIAMLLQGGEDLSQATLSRFFTLHVIVLPVALLGVLGLHLMLIQTLGTSEPPEFQKQPASQKQYEAFFPTFVLKDMMGWMAVFNLTAILVVLFPRGVGPEAQPFAPAPAGIQPEWYFLFLFQFFKLLPPHIGPFHGEQVGMGVFALVVLIFALVPFWDRGTSVFWSRMAMAWGVCLGAIFVALTLWGAWA